MSQFAQIFKIKQLKSTAFHPQSLGSLERSHHTLIEYLKYYVKSTDWDTYLKYAMFSYNTSTHEGTGFTPHELIFGTIAKIPSEFEEERVKPTYNMLFDDILNKLTDTQALAAARLKIAKERSKKQYDKKLNPQNFKVDQYVYLLKEPKKSKFDPQYRGPYKIIRMLENNNVELEVENGKKRIVHMNKLKSACLNIM